MHLTMHSLLYFLPSTHLVLAEITPVMVVTKCFKDDGTFDENWTATPNPQLIKPTICICDSVRGPSVPTNMQNFI